MNKQSSSCQKVIRGILYPPVFLILLVKEVFIVKPIEILTVFVKWWIA